IQCIEIIMQQVLHDLTVELPMNVQEKLQQVEFVVRLEATKEQLEAAGEGNLQGAFIGHPLGQPAIIVLFAGMYFRRHYTDEELYKQVRKDLLHEIGHYFGMNHE